MTLMLFGGSDGSDDEEPKIEINEEFARRYEHNKKREELQRYEELKKKGVIGSDDDSEDDSSEDEVVESSEKDLKFFDALIKVKKQDPVLKDKEAKLFDSDESESEEEDGEDEDKEEKKKKKPMYLKDVTAKHLIEEGPEFEDKEERKKSYVEEQEELRRTFLNAAADEDDDGDDFLKEKKGVVDDFEGDGEGFDKKLDEYFGDDDKLDKNEMFLKDYFRKKMWLEKDDGGKEVLGGDAVDISEDEEEIEKQEDYEREFNFRFEENAGDRVLGHSRVVEGSVRKKTNARKLQRQSKEERMAQAEFERKEELKHLKNLKKKEISEKLKKIRETAGFEDDAACLLDEEDLEEEFDPDEYDKKMKKAFDDDYYEADDADPGFGSDSEEDGNELEKPDFDKEDELLGLPKGWNDVYGSGDGFSAARERTLKQQVEDDVVTEEGKLKKKRKRSAEEKEVLGKELEEYYKLDYEDTIGDLKTRFKYRPVKSKKFGLSTKDVLLLDDKELNQFVSLKKIAPYVEKEWQVPRNKRLEQKQRIKSLIKEASTGQSSEKKALRGDGKKSSEHLSITEKNKQQPDDIQRVQSRHAKRKQNQADLKLSRSRLAAYGKISSNSKSKKKP